MFLNDDVVSYGQPLAGSFTDLFGCEEGVENTLTYILGDTAAVVTNLNFSPVFIMMSADVDTPVASHIKSFRFI